jgi:1-deoxy-D-xylulose-5-phosphate synthase
MSLLSRIASPADLKRLPIATLTALAEEIRAFLIDKVSGLGGHLGSNLGVVELTIAAHRVFTSPRDVLLFDTGHQAYVHKFLTGRCAEFDSLRQADGLSGHPSRAESVHDLIENSHGSEGRGGNRVAPTENTRWRAEETRRPMALRDRTALERRLGPHEARCPV